MANCQYEMSLISVGCFNSRKVSHTNTHTHTGAKSISPNSSLFLSKKVGKNIFYKNTVSIFTGFNWRRSMTHRISLVLVRTTLYFGFQKSRQISRITKRLSVSRVVCCYIGLFVEMQLSNNQHVQFLYHFGVLKYYDFHVIFQIYYFKK
jgi:hypothetical protein